MTAPEPAAGSHDQISRLLDADAADLTSAERASLDAYMATPYARRHPGPPPSAADQREWQRQRAARSTRAATTAHEMTSGRCGTPPTGA